jgi:16S rRNA (guanine(527)-N(7))-methyltransferase RsmG
MDAARIAELLTPFLNPAGDQKLTAGDLLHISTYIDILIRWNARMNLTAIRDPEEIVTRHFGESFFAARHLFPQRSGGCVVRAVRAGDSAARAELRASGVAESSGGAALQRRLTELPSNVALAPASVVRKPSNAAGSAEQPTKLRLADLGSGAGFPGIPIKLWAPDISLSLIESNQKKSVFLREVARALTLTDIDIQNARAESLQPASFDVVTLRAVERFETILPIAKSLIAPSGLLVLLIGSAQLSAATSALAQFDVLPPLPIPASRSRSLLVSVAPS